MTVECRHNELRFLTGCQLVDLCLVTSGMKIVSQSEGFNLWGHDWILREIWNPSQILSQNYSMIRNQNLDTEWHALGWRHDPNCHLSTKWHVNLSTFHFCHLVANVNTDSVAMSICRQWLSHKMEFLTLWGHDWILREIWNLSLISLTFPQQFQISLSSPKWQLLLTRWTHTTKWQGLKDFIEEFSEMTCQNGPSPLWHFCD